MADSPVVPGASRPSPHPWGRRLASAAAFVFVYIGLGFALHLGANAYLVMGVPLAALFQLFVARSPIRAAWVRDGAPIKMGWWLALRALVFAVGPMVSFPEFVSRRMVPEVLWVLAGALGAFGLSYAWGAARSRDLPRLLAVGLASGAPGAMLLGAALLIPQARHGAALPTLPHALAIAGQSFAQYVPVSFAMEEVVFRGVLDGYVVGPGESRLRRAVTTLVLSALWGLWHLPVVGPKDLSLSTIAPLAASLIIVHTIVGIGLTAAWRWRGTLLVPAVGHSFADAVRNALMVGAS